MSIPSYPVLKWLDTSNTEEDKCLEDTYNMYAEFVQYYCRPSYLNLKHLCVTTFKYLKENGNFV